LTMASSGFLGTFAPFGGCVSCGGGSLYMGLFNVPGAFLGYTDEIDLDFGNGAIALGVNNTPGFGFGFYSCQTQACLNAYGESWIASGPVIPLTESTVVTQVHVPDGDSSLPLSLGAFGAICVAYRWRRREV
jgi:hypothetical protein